MVPGGAGHRAVYHDADLAARPLYVDSLEVVARPDADHAVLEMVCGKGGYVRSIARDLGQVLGCLGHVTELRRMWSGPFDLEDEVSLDTVADPVRRTAQVQQVDHAADRLAAHLQWPYVAWVSFATLLNVSIWWLNR